MKKRLADDPKSWGKQEGSGQATAVPTPEPSGLPKPLSLTDIRVGERYVTVKQGPTRHMYVQQLYVLQWTAVSLPHEWGLIDVEILIGSMLLEPTFISGQIVASDSGLVSTVSINCHRTFLATPETIAVIEDIVDRQDKAAYAAIIGVEALYSV